MNCIIHTLWWTNYGEHTMNNDEYSMVSTLWWSSLYGNARRARIARVARIDHLAVGICKDCKGHLVVDIYALSRPHAFYEVCLFTVQNDRKSACVQRSSDVWYLENGVVIAAWRSVLMWWHFVDGCVLSTWCVLEFVDGMYHFAHYIYCILVAISLWICWCLFASYCTSVDRLPWCCIHAAWMRNTRQKTLEKCPRSWLKLVSLSRIWRLRAFLNANDSHQDLQVRFNVMKQFCHAFFSCLCYSHWPHWPRSGITMPEIF